MKISIITIVKDNAKYLHNTISSVLSQKYDNYEYIIIDGVSTDGSIDVIKHYAALDKRIKWISEKDNGISDAMNKGISMSTGDIVAHIHADDYYPSPDVLTSVVDAYLMHEDGLWLTGGIYMVDVNDGILLDVKVTKYSYKKLITGNIIAHPATFVKRVAFGIVGNFDINLKYAMDYDLWLRLGEICSPILVDKPLACFRVHANSLSSREASKATDEAWSIRKKMLEGKPLKILINYLYYRLARRNINKFYKSLLDQNKTE